MSEIVVKEKILNGYPNVIPYESTKKTIEQMEKNIFKITIGNEQATGFFCKIPYNNKIVLMTNYHVIDENKNEIDIKIKEEKQNRIIDLSNRIKYINKEYDIVIIEMNEDDNITNYLELDDNFELNNEYKNKTIYIIQYPEGELSVSYGILNKICIDKKYNFNHLCSTKEGSSGSPILNIKNNKLIGIHKESQSKNFNIGLFLSYPIKEYLKLYKNKLQEFNKKYHLNIQQDTTKINLYFKGIENEGLKDLCQIEFKKLKELNLQYNNISDIKVLENTKYEKLEILDLVNNKISDINILEKVKFKELKKLYLIYNNISDIKVLGNVKFEKLEILSLSRNKISDINILEKVKFKELKILNLGWNKISDINILEKVKFTELKELYLLGNNIWDIKVLKNVKFEKLEILDLNNNKISNINVLEKVKFKELKKLYLNENNISDIKVFENVKFEKLETLSVGWNKIDDESIITNFKIKNIYI